MALMIKVAWGKRDQQTSAWSNGDVSWLRRLDNSGRLGVKKKKDRKQTTSDLRVRKRRRLPSTGFSIRHYKDFHPELHDANCIDCIQRTGFNEPLL